MEWDDSISPRLEPYFPKGQKFARVKWKEDGTSGRGGVVLMDNAKNWLAKYRDFDVKADDIFVSTYPRSGTTWTTELVWLLKNNLDIKKSEIPTMERIPFFDWDSVMSADPAVQEAMFGSSPGIYKEGGCWKVLQNMPSPRVIKTHLPLSLMPSNVVNRCKVIYVARSPSDVLVSNFHFLRSVEGMDIEFDKFFDLFLDDLIWWCPFWDHVRDFWKLRHHPNVLFLLYEDMKKDYSAAVSQVAGFLDVALTDDQVETVRNHLSFNSMQKSPGTSIQVSGGEVKLLRAGKVGTWTDYFNDDMKERMRKWTLENTTDIDIKYPEKM